MEQYIKRWKFQLESDDDRKMNLIALVEIVELLNNVKKENAESVNIKLINSDLSHFIVEIMTYRRENLMSLINKIVCHLSEVKEFYVHDFFKFFKGYLKVLNCFPIANIESAAKYHQDIFNTICIFVKRGREFNCNFADQRFSFNCIASTIGGIGSSQLNQKASLDFVNLMIELFIDKPVVMAIEQTIREMNIFRVLKKLNIVDKNLKDVSYMLMVSMFLINCLDLVQDPVKQTVNQKNILRMIVFKFFSVMQFILNEKGDVNHLEIFYNMIYYLLTSEKLDAYLNNLLINRFFILDGHKMLATMICSTQKKTLRVKNFKSRVVFSEILILFIKLFGDAKSESDAFMRKKSYNVVFNADFKEGFNSEKPSEETMMMYAFVKLVDFLWKKPNFKQSEVLSNSALILATTQLQHVTIHPIFLKMLETLFTKTFINISIMENHLLQVSSNVLLNSALQTSQLDLKYLKWWRAMAKPSEEQLNAVVFKYLAQEDCYELDNLKTDDLEVFNKKILLKSFLNPSTASSVSKHSRLKKILCSFPASDSKREFQMLLQLFMKFLDKPHHNETLINIADMLNANIGAIKCDKMKRKTAEVLLQALITEVNSDSHLKLLMIEIAKNLMRYEM